MIDKIYTQVEVAELLHVSTHYITKLRRQGYLIGRHCGKNWLYTEGDINSFISETAGKDLQLRHGNR